MTHHKKGESGLADIVIFDRPTKDKSAKAVMLIECKNPENPNIDIRDYSIIKTVEDYAKILQPAFLIITKDNDSCGKDFLNQKPIDDNYIPSLKGLTKRKIRYQKPKPYRWTRHSFTERFKKRVRLRYEDKYICWKTKDEKVPNILQLMDLIYDTTASFKPTVLSDSTLKEDYKLRHSNFGYAGSGGLIGDYRCLLLLEQSDGNCRVIGYSVYPQGSWGTYLMITVDERKGHALELQLDKFIKPTGKTTYQIIHNGGMTVGHKGSAKSDLVIQEVKKKAPFLLDGDKVLLGTFDLTKDLKFQQKEVKDFIYRTAIYAILRDNLRKKLQPE